MVLIGSGQRATGWLTVNGHGFNEAQREWKGFVGTNFITVLLSPVNVVGDKEMGHNSSEDIIALR